jgi:hypothetical protein
MPYWERLAPLQAASLERPVTYSIPGQNTGITVRSWIEQWELSLDDIDLEVPEPLTEVDPEEHAFEIEGAPAGPTE